MMTLNGRFARSAECQHRCAVQQITRLQQDAPQTSMSAETVDPDGPCSAWNGILALKR